MAASLLVGLSARLLQWQNPAEFGAQFLLAWRARRVPGSVGGNCGTAFGRSGIFTKSGDSAVAIQNQD
jgi:hypothetical protein